MAREKIIALGKKMTDRIPYKLGLEKLTESDPEYYGLECVVTDDEADVALAMDLRKPTTPEKIAKKMGKPVSYVQKIMDDLSAKGVLEYNYDTPDGSRQYVLPIFVPGAAELMNMNLEQVEKYPQIAKFFERMAFLPLTKITPMVPPGGNGIGMHVIPVEKAIPATNESVSIEHISHWLKKYEGQLGVGYCSCRNAMRLMGEGCGELQEELCIAVGTFARYCVETGKGRYITHEEALRILKRSEENGYVHQITNIDGENKIFAICNCALGSCFALRTSQLFNTPNMSASAYRAHVDKEKCVACGVVVVKFLLDGMVYSASELNRSTGLPVLGALASDRTKKAGKLDAKLYQMEGRPDGSADAEMLCLMAQTIRSRAPEAKNILVTGDLPADQLEALAAALQATEPLRGQSVTAAESILKAAATVPHVVAADAIVLAADCTVTRTDAVREQNEKIVRLGKQILGCIVYE